FAALVVVGAVSVRLATPTAPSTPSVVSGRAGHAPARDTDRAALRLRVSVQHRSGRRAPRACHHLVRPPARRLDYDARRHGGYGARRRRGPSVVRAADRTAGATTLRVVPRLRNAERGTGGEDLA